MILSFYHFPILLCPLGIQYNKRSNLQKTVRLNNTIVKDYRGEHQNNLIGFSDLKYQPCGEGGTTSPPAKSNIAARGPKMADGGFWTF